MNQKLEVSFAKEEPSNEVETCNLLLRDVPTGIDPELLQLYIDNVTKLSAKNGDYELSSMSDGLFLVIFKSNSGKFSVYTFTYT